MEEPILGWIAVADTTAPAAHEPLLAAPWRLPDATRRVTGLALLFLGAGTLVCGAVGTAYDDPDAGVLAASGVLIGLGGLLSGRAEIGRGRTGAVWRRPRRRPRHAPLRPCRRRRLP